MTITGQKSKGRKRENSRQPKKPGEKWERDMREMYKNELISSSQAKTPCVCVRPHVSLSIKVSAASYFSSVAWDVRASSALLPALAPGGFITSLCLRLSRSNTVQRTSSKCVRLFSVLLFVRNWFIFFLLLTWYDSFQIAAVTSKSSHSKFDASYWNCIFLLIYWIVLLTFSEM